MMRERRAVTGAGDVHGEWMLTSEVFWQPKAGEQVSLSRVASSCIHRIHAKFGWILDQSIPSEMWFFFLSEIGNVQL
jgi:hypothetical protein